MQSYKILKLRVIHEETAEQFEKVFNTSMQELEECEPEVEFVHELGFCAYLKYHEMVKNLHLLDLFRVLKNKLKKLKALMLKKK